MIIYILEKLRANTTANYSPLWFRVLLYIFIELQLIVSLFKYP